MLTDTCSARSATVERSGRPAASGAAAWRARWRGRRRLFGECGGRRGGGGQAARQHQAAGNAGDHRGEQSDEGASSVQHDVQLTSMRRRSTADLRHNDREDAVDDVGGDALGDDRGART